MKAHLDAAKYVVEGLGYTAHVGDVPGAATYPYVLLWGSGGDMDADEMDGTQDDLFDLLGVTMVAKTAEAALSMPPLIRQALMTTRLQVPGRFVQPLRLFDSQRVQSDVQVKLPDTNRHPAFVVDLYRVISEPAEEA